MLYTIQQAAEKVAFDHEICHARRRASRDILKRLDSRLRGNDNKKEDMSLSDAIAVDHIGKRSTTSNLRVDSSPAVRELEVLRFIADSLPDLISYVDAKGYYRFNNKAYENWFGLPHKKITGSHVREVIGAEAYQVIKKYIEKALAGHRVSFESSVLCKDGGPRHIYAKYVPDVYERGRVRGYFAIESDVTAQKRAEQLLRDSEFELGRQKTALEQKDMALREMIGQIEIEKNRLKEDIAVNVNNTLLPIISKLKLTEDSVKQRDLLKRHLEALVSSFGNRIAAKSFKLSPKEIEICNMIKGNLTSKEIGNFLNISNQTVEKHRKNIRKKLKLSGKNINLSSYLHGI